MKRFLKLGIVPFLVAEGMLIIITSFISLLYQMMIGFYLGFGYFTGMLSSANGLYGQLQEYLTQDVMYTISVIALTIWGLLSFFWYQSETRGELGIPKKGFISRKTLTLFLLLGLGCQFFFSGMMSLLQSGFPELFKSYNETINTLVGGKLYIVILYTVIVAPVAEELVFRGVVLHKARKVLPFLGANLLQATYFGIYHQNVIQGIYAVLIGFLLGMVCRKYHSVYASILLHMLVNVSAFLVMLLPVSTVGNVIMLIGGAGLAIIPIIGLKLWRYQ